jgi:hypothetical protein
MKDKEGWGTAEKPTARCRKTTPGGVAAVWAAEWREKKVEGLRRRQRAGAGARERRRHRRLEQQLLAKLEEMEADWAATAGVEAERWEEVLRLQEQLQERAAAALELQRVDKAAAAAGRVEEEVKRAVRTDDEEERQDKAAAAAGAVGERRDKATDAVGAVGERDKAAAAAGAVEDVKAGKEDERAGAVAAATVGQELRGREREGERAAKDGAAASDDEAADEAEMSAAVAAAAGEGDGERLHKSMARRRNAARSGRWRWGGEQK